MEGLLNKFKYLLGLSEELDEDQEEVEEEMEVKQQKQEPKQTEYAKQESSNLDELLADDSHKRKKVLKPSHSNIIDLSTPPANEMVIIEPKNFDDAVRVVSLLRSKKAVIVSYTKSNLSSEEKTAICNFISGAICAIDGNQEVIANEGVFLFTPGNISINNMAVQGTAGVVDKTGSSLFMTINDMSFHKKEESIAS